MPLLAHNGDNSLADVHNTEEIGLNLLCEIVESDVFDRRCICVARIIHNNVDSAESFVSLSYCCLYCFSVSNIKC